MNTLKFFAVALISVLAACGGTPAPAGNSETPVASSTALAVHLSSEQRRDAGVSVATASALAIAETMTVYGEISTADDRLRRIAARYPGVARKVTRQIGDLVQAGETLVIVESSDSLVPYRITAPIAGRVLERHINDGETLSEQTLFVIGDLSRVWALLSVFPNDAVRIHAGLPVDLRIDREADAQRATLDYVAPGAGGAGGHVLARASLDNRDARWRPGQFVAGDIVLAEHLVAVAVPLTAIQDLDGKPHVFVEAADGYRAREVRLGRQDRRSVELLDGVQAGERVVVSNSYLLKTEWLSQGE